MAWSSAVLSSTVRALAAADKPLLAGGNRIADADAFEWSTAGSLGGADISATDGPARYAFDGYSHLKTKPNAGATTQYLLFDLGSNVTFDVFAVLQHNLGTLTGVTVTLEVADESTFTTNLTTISTLSPGSSNKRLVDLALRDSGDDAMQITARYVRLKLVKGSSFTPEIGEVILTVRRQLKHAPSLPWGDSDLETKTDTHESSSGIETDYVLYEGRRRIDAMLKPSESTYRDDLRTFWLTDTNKGRRPFLWIDEPASDPQGALWMKTPKDFRFPWVGPAEKNLRLVAREQGPQFVSAES